MELRLLQRDVEIILESNNNNNFIGTILHPKGNIAELLLKEGFARCVDWSLSLISKTEAERLRNAERQAKDSRKRIWKDWVSTAPKISASDKEFNATVCEIIGADALNVKLADGSYKKIFLASIRPPRESGRINDDEGKPIPRPKGFRPLYDIPYMFEAREYLRKKLIGKKVHVVVDYIQEARDGYPSKVCTTIAIGGK